MKCVGDQQQGHEANHCCGNFVFDGIRWVTFLCRLAVTTGNIQVLKK